MLSFSLMLRLSVAIIIVSSSTVTTDAHTQVELVPVLRSKLTVPPGYPDTVTLTGIGVPAISSGGIISFSASLNESGPNGESGKCIFVADAQLDLHLIAHIGDTAPPATKESGPFFDFREPLVSSIGSMAFAARIGNPSFHGGEGAWAWTAELGLYAAANYPIPIQIDGVTSGLYTPTEPLVFGNDGSVAFTNNLQGPDVTLENNYGCILVREEDGASMVARLGSPMPGFPPDVLVEAIGTPSFAPNGDLLLTTTLDGLGINRRNQSVVWNFSAITGPAILLRGGMQAVGLAPGQNYMDFAAAPTVNTRGELAFVASLDPRYGITTETDSGVWVTSGSGLTMVAQEGHHAPGTLQDTMFDSFMSRVVYNDRHEAAFRARLRGPSVDDSNDEGLWRVSTDGVVSLIARKGDTPPGLEPHVRYSEIFCPVLNNKGTIVFDAAVEGPGLDFFDDYGVWATNYAGDVRLVLWEGDSYFTQVLDEEPRFWPLYEIAVRRPDTDTDLSPQYLSDSGVIAMYVSLSPGVEWIMLALIPQDCPADVNEDRVLSPADFSAWVAAFNSDDSGCDQNADRFCSPADFSAWVANYNAGCDW